MECGSEQPDALLQVQMRFVLKRVKLTMTQVEKPRREAYKTELRF